MARGIGTILTINAANSEATTTIVPPSWSNNGKKPPIIYCHGRDGAPTVDPFDSTAYPFWKAMTDAGYPIVVGTNAGTRTYGNDAAITSVGQAKTYGQGSAVGGKSGAVPVLGVSMGALAACNYARANPTLVSCLVLIIPATELEWPYSLGAPYSTEIDTAYTNHAGYLAALPTHSPKNYIPDIINIPTVVFYATDDTTQNPTLQAQFASDMGAEVHTHTGGHTIVGIDLSALVRFLNTHA